MFSFLLKDLISDFLFTSICSTVTLFTIDIILILIDSDTVLIKMSHFFNFDAPDAATIYHNTRCPLGVDVSCGLMSVHCGKPLKVAGI